MTNIILGTAGHIDHGKTALMKVLTGADLDRLKEEKQRGITIELGFASFALSGGQKIGVVDVPGHEKFIKRMVAGAGGVDLVLLVVAADDGVMPQTKEHLDICELLGIKHGLVAITKMDLAEPEWLDLVREDVARLATGTFLEGAPIIPVSALTREGIPELTGAIESIVSRIQKPSASATCFLPVDRVFSMKGFGTVVTGTLVSGAIRVGETVEVMPAGVQAKVRGVQVYNAPAEVSLAGQRTAINLQGVEKDSLRRGDVLSYPGLLRPSFRFDVRLKLLSEAPRPLKHGEQVRLHLFTALTLARVIGFEKTVVEPGATCEVQLRLSEPMVALPGARFVIRNLDATRTIGGGEILDTLPLRHRRSDHMTKEWFQALEEKDLEAVLVALALNQGTSGITKKEVGTRINAPRSEIESTWARLLAAGTLVEIGQEGERMVHRKVLQDYAQRLQDLLEALYQKDPIKPGVPVEEVRQRLGSRVPEKFFEHLLREMKEKGAITVSDVTVSLAGRQIALSPAQARLREAIVEALERCALSPLMLRELSSQFSASPEEIKKLLELLVKEGKVLKIDEELYFFREPVIELRKKLVDHLATHKEITPAGFKEMAGVSRKFAIPLLEHFDREKVTIRVGDKRLLRDRKAARG